MRGAWFGTLLCLSLAVPGDAQDPRDEAYFQDIAFDRVLPVMVSASSVKVVKVKAAARAVKCISTEGGPGTAFFFENPSTLVTARNNLLHQGPPDDFLASFRATDSRTKTEAEVASLSKKVAGEIHRKAKTVRLTNPGEKVLFNAPGKDDAVGLSFYLDPDGLTLYRRYLKAEAEQPAGIALYTQTDFAVLSFKEKPKANPTPIKLAAKPPEVGSLIYVIGTPGVIPQDDLGKFTKDKEVYVSVGKVIALKDGCIWHNAHAGGFSPGSPIVNPEGELVGIHTLELKLPSGKLVRGGPAASSIVEYREHFPPFVKDLRKHTK